MPTDTIKATISAATKQIKLHLMRSALGFEYSKVASVITVN
ncbi:MAG: hypothetical protein OFPII_20550 [Osedax symbiont Rs1]|nr:MAG: hypothetical protein OFPII_20550 [Osedax symbiont Rs1]